MGPSFAYIIAVFSIINDFSDSNFTSERQVYKLIVLGIRYKSILDSLFSVL